MRFRLRKKEHGKHGALQDEEKEHDPKTATITRASNHELTSQNANNDDPRSTRNGVYTEGLDSTESFSVVSSSTRPESVSENLIILLSVYSLNGLTITERDEPIVKGISIKRRGKRKEGPEQKRKLQETLARHPTRVAVSSVEGEIANEGYLRETYLPSLLLTEKNFWKSKQTGSRICTVYWPDAETADDRSVLNKSPLSTIKLNRTMTRVVYQRDLAAKRASHFRHKRIDLNISLCRGTEILRLGVSNIVISGNEEDEQLINAPVRPRAKATSPRVRCWIQPKNDDMVFSDDPTQVFSLADNATLCLGVRVVSHAIIQHEELFDEQERIYRIESEIMRNEKDKSVIHLSDDNDLVSRPSLAKSESQRSSNSLTADIFPFLGCCASDLLSFPMLVGHAGRDETPEMPHFYTNKTSEATVTPIYLLSDMSESTAEITEDGTVDETEEGTRDSSALFEE